MSELALKTAKMLDMLPKEEQEFAYELMRKLVRSWDPDFTKLTPEEALRLDEAEADAQTIPLDEVMRSLGLSE